ncbi:YtpI family protein [Thalassobacillus sp. CUG 92003]|uniref:YtpI family protein n=1 Tax=Thalassobacillus sp. CUG 92003 TaxID=2736641 RepID=UPI0015E69AFB
MFIFSALILISLVMYVYYKVTIIKTKDPLMQEYQNSKARICLGSFILFFAINQYLAYETQLSLFIGIAFILIGVFQIRFGTKSLQHYKREYQRTRVID